MCEGDAVSNSDIQMTPQGALYGVPGSTQGLKLLPAVMTDGEANLIGSVDQGNGFSAVLATQIGGPVSPVYSEQPTARAASGNSGGLTSNPIIEGMQGLFLGVNVTALSGSSLVVSLQQLDANGVWQTIASTATITATGTANTSAGAGTANPTMLNGGPYRLAWAITGPSVTFQMALQGR